VRFGAVVDDQPEDVGPVVVATGSNVRRHPLDVVLPA
jgi:hypothetical protein